MNGVTASWILDTGANFSTVSAGFARRLGVKAVPGVAQTQGSSGAENRLRVAILPSLRLGGATVHNIVLLIPDDENLDIALGPRKHYKIAAILGYPVFQALGAVTFTRAGEFEAGATPRQTGAGARLYMDKLTPLLECAVSGRKLLFSFDTGATNSVFSVRYYREFSSAFQSLKRTPYGMSGAGGIKKIRAYVLPQALLNVGGITAALHRVAVIPVPMGTDLDEVYGNLGRDLIAGFSSFTLDFGNMRFGISR